ncbi:hypothetical protein SAMN05216511_7224 [Streptomyces sp. KS_16]|nr:hypothetical protein BX261_7345 [Streptomyces sp. 2321.6]SDR61927.1 hypothetical protein SAMN05216511_7224 [Streptomyces sp. KS_16]SEE48954.1 hypothetical protein SAMN05428940_7273 [Streptomyces sp. 2133.1]SNC77766.1 hypothetical protein SAMN06272741_7182 [Streptomyces sp. 2114.4]
MRIDPALTEATCPSCQQIVGSPPGQPVTTHQKPDGSRETCPGGLGQ